MSTNPHEVLNSKKKKGVYPKGVHINLITNIWKSDCIPTSRRDLKSCKSTLFGGKNVQGTGAILQMSGRCLVEEQSGAAIEFTIVLPPSSDLILHRDAL